VDGFLGLLELDVVELHPWNATVDDLEHPDRIVIDLDPGEGVPWELLIETALRMRELLAEQDIDSWLAENHWRQGSASRGAGRARNYP